MKKKVFAIAMAGVMSVSIAAVFAGCGGNGSGEIEWLIMRDDDQEIPLAENPVMCYWQEQTGLDVTWYDPASKNEAWSQQLIDGEYSEIVDLSLNSENLTTLEQDGVIWNIAPYIEECMPNFWSLMQQDEWSDIRRNVYVGDKLYTVPIINEVNNAWGGIMYRHDMVVDVRGEDFTWPSGEEIATTLADWDYILESVSMYYDKHNIQGAYEMYLPPEGYYQGGLMLSGFGVSGQDYVVDDTVHFGAYEEGFYTYLEKVKEWYNKGYISPDFSAADFVFPSTDQTSIFTNRLGIFLGFTQFLGDQMQGMINNYDAQGNATPVALSDPLTEVGGTALGIVSSDIATRVTPNTGYAITTACDEETVKTILKALDWFFSEEGSRTRTMGLSSAQGAAECEYYINKGVTNGTRLPDSETWTEEMDNLTGGGTGTTVVAFAADRMPGVRVDYTPRKVDGQYAKTANEVWQRYGADNTYAYVVTTSQTPEESAVANPILAAINDYANGAIANFILGRTELNATTFASYRAELESLGIKDYLEVKQAAYDRYYGLD